jgi:hypothetical protein
VLFPGKVKEAESLRYCNLIVVGKNNLKMGFTAKNSYSLALMTIAFIIGEIAHFLLGKKNNYQPSRYF